MTATNINCVFAQENQSKLFKEIIQFNPGRLQKGGGSGLGLYSKSSAV